MGERSKTGLAKKAKRSTYDSSLPHPLEMAPKKLLPEWCGYESSHRTFDLHLMKFVTSSMEYPVSELVALWVGADISKLALVESIPEWLTEISRQPPTQGNAVARIFSASFGMALRALHTGELASGPLGLMTGSQTALVKVFFEWACKVKLPRVVITDQPRQGESELGAYSHSPLDVAQEVRRIHYRYTSHGGTLDLADSSTHPHPEDVKQTIRDLGVTVKAQIEEIYKMVRDRNIPVGRRRKGAKE